MGRHRGAVITRVSKIQKLISELFIFSDELIRFYNFMDFQYITSSHRGDLQSATNIIAEGSEEELFKNLDAEQARHSYTNQRMADMVGISRVSYENKKKNGKFTALEAKKMCKIFKVKFDYLFATDEDEAR